MDFEEEVAWRVEAMRPQIPTEERFPFPFLQARPGTEAVEGHCFSCGDVMEQQEGEQYRGAMVPRVRCDACTAAAVEVVS